MLARVFGFGTTSICIDVQTNNNYAGEIKLFKHNVKDYYRCRIIAQGTMLGKKKTLFRFQAQNLNQQSVVPPPDIQSNNNFCAFTNSASVALKGEFACSAHQKKDNRRSQLC